MKTFFWDFVGPYSKDTAAHHAKHLEEFLARNALEGCEVGVQAHNPMRHSAWLKASAEAEAPIVRALRPPRFEEGT